jgi:hypothetical protein
MVVGDRRHTHLREAPAVTGPLVEPKSRSVIPLRVKAFANYHNSRLAAVEAKVNGHDWPVFLNDQQKVTKGPAACVGMVRDGVLITRPSSWRPAGGRPVGGQRPRLAAAGTHGGRRAGDQGPAWAARPTAQASRQAALRQGLRLPALPAGTAPTWDHAQDRPARHRVQPAAWPTGMWWSGRWPGWSATGGCRSAMSDALTSCWGSCTWPAR